MATIEDPIEMIDRVMKDVQTIRSDPKLRELYFDREKAKFDRMAAAKAVELREESARAQGETEGMVEGGVEGICKYLNVRFGTESQDLQRSVQMINDLDRLNQIMERIFKAKSLNEAESIIQEI